MKINQIKKSYETSMENHITAIVQKKPKWKIVLNVKV